MSLAQPLFVIVAHPDDWQIFAGATVYEYLRDPSKRVTIVTLTAGDGGRDSSHWKSRQSGAMLSVARVMGGWSAYSIASFSPAPLPSALCLRHEQRTYNHKAVLTTTIEDGTGATACLHALHLPDGGFGDGFPPRNQSLGNLHNGRSQATTLWPEANPSTYTTLDDVVETLVDIVERTLGGFDGRVDVLAPDATNSRNPGDHADHVVTGMIVERLLARVPQLRATWIAMYDVANRPENLEAERADLQRAATYAYGAGYTANMAAASPIGKRGWERELEAYGGREYVHRDDS